jgi:thioredoxin-related protein
MLTIPAGFAQLKNYSFEEAEQLSRESPKPIVVFVHTSWCKYCKMMENITFKNPEVIRILNGNFYFILLDAESKNDIAFNDRTFKFKPTGPNTGVHELAIALSTVNNQITYPTITIIDRNYSILFHKQSYIKTKDLISILGKIN